MSSVLSGSFLTAFPRPRSSSDFPSPFIFPLISFSISSSGAMASRIGFCASSRGSTTLSLISFVMSFVACRNSFSAIPSFLAYKGSLSGPMTSSATIKTSSNSVNPIFIFVPLGFQSTPDITWARKEGVAQYKMTNYFSKNFLLL